MKVSDFDYPLDESLIAQTPLTKRDESKLMILNRKTGMLLNTKILEIVNYLKKGDALVLKIRK